MLKQVPLYIYVDVAIKEKGPSRLCFNFELVSPSIGSYFFVTR
jgi:hypothetical protein